MRKTIGLLSLSLVLGPVGVSRAQEFSQQKFERHVNKFVGFGDRKVNGRNLCVCQIAPSKDLETPPEDVHLANSIGYMRAIIDRPGDHTSGMFCTVPTFDDAGVLVATEDCSNFIPLRR